MKKIITIIFSLLFLTIILSYYSSKNSPNPEIKSNIQITAKSTQDIIEAGYNQLTSTDKDEISENLNEAKVSKIVLKQDMGKIIDKSYIGKEIYLIDFLTVNNKVRPNNIVIYLSIDSNKLIGYGYLD